MSEEGLLAIRAAKCSRVIRAISELYDVTIPEATDIYYTSETAQMIEEGVADLQCRSEKYIASVIWDEYNETKANKGVEIDDMKQK